MKTETCDECGAPTRGNSLCFKCASRKRYAEDEAYRLSVQKAALEYYHRNKERCLAAVREYQSKNQEAVRMQQAKKYQTMKAEVPHLLWARNTINRHRHAGFDVSSLDGNKLAEYAAATPCCPICDNELEYLSDGQGPSAESASLDRIYNDSVLTEENTMILCHSCNTMKGNGTLEDLVIRLLPGILDYVITS